MKKLICVGLVVIICLVFFRFGVPRAICMWRGRALPPPNAAQLKDIEKQMQLKLPGSARAVTWSHGSAVGDWFILFKVEILSSDMSVLIADSPFTRGSLTSEGALFYTTDCFRWWDEGGEAQEYMFGKTSLPEDRELEILVDMDRKDVYVVYLALFGS